MTPSLNRCFHGCLPLAFAAVLAACGGSSSPAPGGEAGAGANPGIAAGEPAPGGSGAASGNLAGDARDAVQKAIRAQLAQKAYKVVQTTTSQNGSVESEIVYVAPDRYHMSMQLPLSGAAPGAPESAAPTGLGTSQQFIMIGDKVWMQLNGQWMASDAMGGAAKAIADGLHSQYGDWEAGITDVQRLGAEIVDGQPTQAYAYASSIKMGGQAASSEVKLWIRDADSLPVRLQVASAFAGFSSQTTQSITYDDTLSVEPPAEE